MSILTSSPSGAPTVPRVFRAVLALAVAFLAAVALSVTAPALQVKAHASGSGCSPTDPLCASNGGQSGGGGTTPSPGGGGGTTSPGGGGGTSDPPPPACTADDPCIAYSYQSGTQWWTDPKSGGPQHWPSGLPTAAGGYHSCPTSASQPNVGVTWSYTVRTTVIDEGNPPTMVPSSAPVSGSGAIRCLYDNRSLNTVACILSAGAGTIVGPAYNGDGVTSSTIKRVAKQTSAFFNGGEKQESMCAASLTVSVGTKQFPGYGVYVASVPAAFANCSYYSYTGAKNLTDDWLGCSAPYTTTHTNYLTVECGAPPPGYIPGNHYAGFSFSATDCNDQHTSNYTWSCKPGTPKIDGSTINPQQVFDSGEPHKLTWPNSHVAGNVKNLTNKSSRLYVSPDSSPWRGSPTDGNADSPTQPFVTTPTADAWQPGWLPSWTTRLMQASLSGKSWTAYEQYRVTGSFLSTVTTVTGLNPITGAWQLTTKQEWQTHTGVCNTSPVHLNVKRARNSS